MKKTSEDEEKVMPDAVPYDEQRPYIAAFRKYIKNPHILTERGTKWTPKKILKKLYELSPNRSAKNEDWLNFYDKNAQCLQRLRGDRPKYAVQDRSLFLLIQAFLKHYKIPVVPATLSQSFRHIAACANAVFPRSGRLPDMRSAENERGVLVYQLNAVNPEGKDTLYLAFKAPKRTVECLTAIVYATTSLEFRIGLYIPSIGECFAKGFYPTPSTYRRFLFSSMSSQQDDRLGRTFRSMHQGRVTIFPAHSDEPISARSPQGFMMVDPDFLDVAENPLALPLETPEMKEIGCVAIRVAHTEAIAFATEFFESFDN